MADRGSVSEVEGAGRHGEGGGDGSIRVLVSSRHKLIKEGLARLLRQSGDPIVPVSEAGTADEVLEQISVARPEAILLHVSHTDECQLSLLQEKAPDIPVVLLTDA